MGEPNFEAAVDFAEGDQATHVGVLDRGRVGDPLQRRQFDRLPNRKRVDDVAHRVGERSYPRLDQFGQAGRHDRIAAPPPMAVPLRQPPVGHLLLDDVAEVQHVAAGELPQPLDGVWIHRAIQRR